MEQILQKKYWLKYQHSGKDIILTRRLGGYLVDRAIP